MKWVTISMVLMLVFALFAPAAAEGGERYSYIAVKDVTIQLERADASITMNYTIDGGISFLVLLLGKSDLRQKALTILNFDDARVDHLDLNRIEVYVDNVSEDYGQGSYWFPAHRFGVTIPSLTVITPQDTKRYENISTFPEGFGYFA